MSGGSAARESLVPKAYTLWRDGTLRRHVGADLLAGLTVAIVALPLAIALAVASGATPATGIWTAAVGGLLVALLGGSRVQVSGPTGAFIPVVLAVAAVHGHAGMIAATFLAGLLLLLAAWLRLGRFMRFMPQPVITGFTAGIAVIILVSQLPDALGLASAGEGVASRLLHLWRQRDGLSVAALLLTAGCVLAILLLRRRAPRAPGYLLVVLGAALLTRALSLPVETLGQRFPELAAGIALPELAMPHLDLAALPALLPAALTIAFLAGIESLLSAVVADGMCGTRHRPNAELLAHGVANCGSALVGGLPVTGAIARTATNVRAGARTPLASATHALLVAVLALALGPLLVHLPMPALAAVLIVVALGMAESERFRHLLRAPRGDRWLLLVTFGLTVLVDLTVAIEVGLVLAAFVFMSRMAESVRIAAGIDAVEEDEAESEEQEDGQRRALPEGVEAFQIQGPLFFGATSHLEDAVRGLAEGGWPRVLIVRTRQMPMLDASGVASLELLIDRARRTGGVLLISGLRPQPRRVLDRMGIREVSGVLEFVPDFEAALRRAVELQAIS